MSNKELQNKIGIKVGISFNEKYTDTNSIFLSLHHNQPIQVRGKEHFHEAIYNFSCSSCMFELKDGLKGTITLMTNT